MSAFLTRSIRRVRSWLPHSYQKDGVKLGVSQACLGLLYDPGMGKTTTCFAIVKILLAKKLIKRVLVIGPLRVVNNVWPVQCKEWKEFEDLRVGVFHGSGKDQVDTDDYDIVCINPEGLNWLTGAVHKKKSVKLDPGCVKFIKENFDMLIVDESTQFKDSSTKRFHTLRKLIPLFRRRMILTGTIVPNGLLDLFGQIYILDEGATLKPYITQYRSEFFYPHGWGGFDYQPQPDAEERIVAKIAPLVHRLEARDYLELPEVFNDDRFLQLPDGIRHQYVEMEHRLMTQVELGRVVAANAGVATSKCRQIANGGLYVGDEKHTWVPLHELKIDALEDLIDEMSGQPLLIAYEFEFDWERIAKRLKVPRIGVSAKKDKELIQAFRRGDLPTLMGHPNSISLGLDGLQDHCSHICWYSIPWNLLHYQQTIDRVARQGSTASRVINHRLIMSNTVDERVLEVLGVKGKRQSDFLELLK